jgi:hypothetical protein
MTQRCVRSPQKPRLHYSPNPLIVWMQKSRFLSLSPAFGDPSLSTFAFFFLPNSPYLYTSIHFVLESNIPPHSVSNVLSAYTPALAYLSAPHVCLQHSRGLAYSSLASLPRAFSSCPLLLLTFPPLLSSFFSSAILI